MKLRSNIEQMRGYTPGEQPRDGDWIKLNTNESFECSPAALKAVRALRPEDLRLYPDPSCTALRSKLAGMFGVSAGQIVVGNGSDDILNLLVRLTCDPGAGVVFTKPSYSLYPVLAEIQGARIIEVPLGKDFKLPVRKLSATRGAILFITSPNNPAGTSYPKEQIAEICRSGQNLVVVDEAYADFAHDDCLELLATNDNLCIVRSLSKSYGLAGLRIGYAIGPAPLAAALMKIKDSYNVSRAAQTAALAALDDSEWARGMWRRLVGARERLARTLTGELGLKVYPSQANFVLVDFGDRSALHAMQVLRERKILVRHFPGDPTVQNCLRITVGGDVQIAAVLDALRAALAAEPQRAAGST